MRTSSLSESEYAAVCLRRELGISVSEAIRFPYVFQRMNIRFRKANLSNNILGASKVEGLNRLIVVSSRKEYASKERFTTAHELGHVALRHGYSQCKFNDIYGQKTRADKENEANDFASAFLLPPSIVSTQAQAGNVTINVAGKLRKQYDISLTSALIALVKSSPFSVCVFFQSKDAIDYSIRSPGCLACARKGTVMPRSGIKAVSLEHRQHNSACDYTTWFYEKPGKDYNCSEETLYLPNYQIAISIVQVWEKD